MNIEVILSFFVSDPFKWVADWAFGLPLITATVLFHAFGLGVIRGIVARVSGVLKKPRRSTTEFMVVMGTTTLLAIFLHAIEALIWAFTYCFIGALPDLKSAMLYSLNALTSYGHHDLVLEDRWRLMGAIEALNGWLLFGLTTAFLFGMIERVWSSDKS